jgi:hypothetical protein
MPQRTRPKVAKAIKQAAPDKHKQQINRNKEK